MFGKTMENLRNRRTIDIVSKDISLRRFAAQPSFKRVTIFKENLVAVERSKRLLVLNKPNYIGFAALDLSKSLMYDFHYNYIKERYPGERSKLLFTDTDSLCYAIKTYDIYEDFLENKELFDFSDYPKSHKCHSIFNKKVIGKTKDELASLPLEEFVGLKAKMYSLLYHDHSGRAVESKKAKDVKKCSLKRSITHRHYLNSLFNNSTYNTQMTTIRSYQHKLYTIEQNKKSLSSFDDKRYILNDGVSTIAHGHYKIKEMEDRELHFDILL